MSGVLVQTVSGHVEGRMHSISRAWEPRRDMRDRGTGSSDSKK